jgi:predicted RNA binding protein YcfA (HicA-like mRNA interferase family)
MKLPRDMDAQELIKALARLGYRVVRQSGSHIRLQADHPKPHALTIPNHSPLKLGTLMAILNDVAQHHDLSRDDLIARLLDR